MYMYMYCTCACVCGDFVVFSLLWPPPYHRSLNSVRVPKAKYVVWSQDMSHVAILGRNGKWAVMVSG